MFIQVCFSDGTVHCRAIPARSSDFNDATSERGSPESDVESPIKPGSHDGSDAIQLSSDTHFPPKMPSYAMIIDSDDDEVTF